MPLFTKTKRWLFDHRYSLLTILFGFICASIVLTLLTTLGLVEGLSFSMRMLPWEMLTTMTACAYVAGGLLASFTLPFFPIKPLKSSLPTITRFTDALSGVFFPIAIVGSLIWGGIRFLRKRLGRRDEYTTVDEESQDEKPQDKKPTVDDEQKDEKSTESEQQSKKELDREKNAKQAPDRRELNFALFTAAKQRDANKVTALIEQGANVDATRVNLDRYNNEMTALHMSAVKGHVEVVDALIDQGADVNAVGVNPGIWTHGITALHCAACLGHIEVVNALIDRGANVNAAQVNPGIWTHGITALHCAAYLGHIGVVNALIDRGADVNAAPVNPGIWTHGMTALHWATKKNHVDVINALITEGANVVPANPDEFHNGTTALHYATNNCSVEAINTLIAAGADLNAKLTDPDDRRNGMTPLQLAAMHGYIEVVNILIDNGADVNAVQVTQDSSYCNGRTALHWAAWSSHVEIVNTLIARGANVNAVQTNADIHTGVTVLHLAAMNGYVKVVKALIDSEADVNATQVNPGSSCNGMTALHYAAEKGSAEVVDALIAGGANVNLLQEDANSYTNMTALHYAAQGGHLNIVNTLIAGGTNLNPALLDFIIKLDYIIKKGRTPLHWAAKEGHVQAVNVLIERGDNVDALQVSRPKMWPSGRRKRPFGCGMTPLHWAAKNNHVNVVNALILANADVDVRQVNHRQWNNGMTPLHYGVFYGRLNVVEALIAGDANIHTTDAEGRTPIVVAYERGYNHTNPRCNIVALLERHGAILPERYRQQRIETGRHVDVSTININGSQSTHTASVHDDVSTSIIKLKQRYNKIDVKKTLEEIMDWIEPYKDSENDKLRLAYEGFYRSMSIDFADSRSGITLVEALAYVWWGVNDEAQIDKQLILSEKDREDAAKVQTAIVEMKRERRNDYLQHLYERKNEYNLDAQGNKVNNKQGKSAEGCTSGGFNKIVETLNGGKHEDVLIRVIKKEQAVVKVPVLLAQKLLDYDNEQAKHDWACAWYLFPAENDADEQGGKANVAGPSEAMAEQFHGVILEELKEEFGRYVTEIDIQDAADYVNYASPSQSIKEYVKVVTVLSNVLHAYAHQLNHHANQQEKLRWERGWRITNVPGEQLFNHFEQAVFAKIREAFKAEIISGKKLEQILALLKYAITRKTGKGKAPQNADDNALDDICEKLGGYLTKETLLGICDYFIEVAPIVPRVEQKVEPKGKKPETVEEDKKQQGETSSVSSMSAAMKERGARMHLNERKKIYKDNLAAFAQPDKALMALITVATGKSDDFQDKFVVNGNNGKDFSHLEVLQKQLAERMSVYEQTISKILEIHTGYSFEVQGLLKTLQESILDALNKNMKVLKDAVDDYLENSHRLYGDKFPYYCAIQSQYPDVVKFDKELQTLLPKILEALPNDIEKLKECRMVVRSSLDERAGLDFQS